LGLGGDGVSATSFLNAVKKYVAYSFRRTPSVARSLEDDGSRLEMPKRSPCVVDTDVRSPRGILRLRLAPPLRMTGAPRRTPSLALKDDGVKQLGG
jgi:hypothetical protein